ncbi:hypothetical protein [Sulfurimonas sp.]|uniref:hypothetical protein n=1 Tax=Sulfurimonas sp. TaxID=2022749 RepID=UPI0026345C9E|nr:hypothetical protein [Sulfurimonas sp.]
MNDSMEEELRKKRDMLYYNQLVTNERKAEAKRNKKLKKKRSTSFGSQKVDFKDYIYVPEEWEGLAYAIYFVLVPYITGAIFLFLVVARGSYENFMLLNLNAFPIVWIIGYEIVAVCLLVWILVLFLNYDPEDDDY